MGRPASSIFLLLVVALAVDLCVCQSADDLQPPVPPTEHVAHVRTKLHTRLTHRRHAVTQPDGEPLHVMSTEELTQQPYEGGDVGDGFAACGAALQVPKVALLFMSTGNMPMERVWARWFNQAAGMLPIDKVGSWCSTGTISWPESLESQDGQMTIDGAKVSSMCAQSLRTASTAMQRQALFSAYVHLSHGTGPLTTSSMFYKHVIPVQLDAQRFTHTMVEAERALLAAALQDPLNERFALVSDSSLPLYDAVLVYEQFMSQGSYQDACDLDAEGWAKVDGYRYHDDMNIPGKMSYDNWRKSSQWFVLTRGHAEIVRDDALVDPVFKSQCWNDEDSRERLCCSDEHYIPTLLNVLGEKSNTNCAWGSHYVNWELMWGNGHPHTYTNADLTTTVFKEARKGAPLQGMCQSDAAPTLQSLFGRFVHAHELDAVLCRELTSGGVVASADNTASAGTLPRHGPFVPLDPKCPVFFRKVDSGAVELAEAISFGVLGMARR